MLMESPIGLGPGRFALTRRHYSESHACDTWCRGVSPHAPLGVVVPVHLGVPSLGTVAARRATCDFTRPPAPGAQACPHGITGRPPSTHTAVHRDGRIRLSACCPADRKSVV